MNGLRITPTTVLLLSLGVPAAILALAAGTGCGPKAPPPVAPEAHLPPDVSAVHPTARSIGVFYGTEIWAKFEKALDPTTVNDRTVFLKLDTGRVPITVAYDALERRIRLVPQIPLALRRTYTVELTPGIATADGGSFPEAYYWQFSTNSLRRPGTPSPANNAVGESPVTGLFWSPTEPSAGDIRYRVYVSTDSEQVATHGVTPWVVGLSGRYLPNVRWTYETTLFWSVTAVNQTTSEELQGPVWWFRTVPADTPVDSLMIQPFNLGYFDTRLQRWFCGSFYSGPQFSNAARWNLSSVDPGIKLAGVKLTVAPISASNPLSTYFPTVSAHVAEWQACNTQFIGPPPIDETGPLSDGVFESSSLLSYSADLLAAHVEATARRRSGFYGYSLRTARQLIMSPGEFRLKLYYYPASAAPAP